MKAQKTETSAKVVDGKLILSLISAQTPVVWQMDLAHVKASAMEVLEDKKAGAFTLSLKTPQGKASDIATFDNREGALQGLMAASNALENAEGKIRGGATSGAPNTNIKKRGGAGKWVLLGLFVLGAWLVYSYAMMKSGPLVYNDPFSPAAQSGEAGIAQSAGPDATQSQGVPVSADDYFSGL